MINFLPHLLSLWIGGLGIFSMVTRKSLLGVLMGTQILGLGLSMLFIVLKAEAPFNAQSASVGYLILLLSLLQLSLGFFLLIRLFYKRKTVLMENIQIQKG